MKGFALQLKPVGSFCNLQCQYPCYADPFKTDKITIMSDVVWKRAITNSLAMHNELTITWHGGEPTLAGTNFYKRVCAFIRTNCNSSQKIRHVMQTNGVLINRAFAEFLSENRFEVGISIDGPKDVHNTNRVDRFGKPSFRQVLRGLSLLRNAGLNPSVIATVAINTLPYAEKVFEFLINEGFTSIKYSPVFDSVVEAFSISSEQWYGYLSKVFDKWMEHGNPDISILDIDEVVAWLDFKGPHPMCSSNRTCMRWISIDPNGDMYPCAYFRATKPYGNILTKTLEEVIRSSEYREFKKIFINPPEKCRSCRFFKLCGNGCPATRLTGSKLDPAGVYVYCEERRKLFKKIYKAFILESRGKAL